MLNGGKFRKYDFCESCMFYLGAVVVLLVGQAAAGVIAYALGDKIASPAANGVFNTAFMIVLQLISAAFIAVYSHCTKRSFNFSFVGEGEGSEAKHPLYYILPVVTAVVLMAGIFLPTMWYGYFTRYALHIPPEAGAVDLSHPASVVCITIASVFLAPLCEEVIYRGVLFNGLKSGVGAVKAVLFSALAFMLMHMNVSQVVVQFALGAVSAVVMYAGGRLISCVLLHAAANSVALVIELTPLGNALGGCVEYLADNVALAFFVTLAFALAAAAVIFVIIKFGFMRIGKAARDEQSAPDTAPEADETAGEREKLVAGMRKKDGIVRYAIAASVCGLMLVVNTLALALGGGA